MRGSGWATDWPKADRGLHELARAANDLLRKGVGLTFLPAQEEQKLQPNAAAKKWARLRTLARSKFVNTGALPLRIATLASGEENRMITPTMSFRS